MTSLPTMTPVTSSNLSALGHDGSHTYVQFKSGGLWRYPTSAAEHAALVGAESVGRHFHAFIKGRNGEKVG